MNKYAKNGSARKMKHAQKRKNWGLALFAGALCLVFFSCKSVKPKEPDAESSATPEAVSATGDDVSTARKTRTGAGTLADSSPALPSGEVFLEPQTPAGPGSKMNVRGTVVVFGNEPHTYAGIRTEDGKKTFAVYPPQKEQALRRLQGHIVDFTVVLLDAPRGEASLYLKDGTVDPLSWKIVNTDAP